MASLNIYIRHLWYDYKSEFYFGLLLIAIVLVSQWLARFIPVDLFETFINPALSISFATVCLFGSWLCFRHSEGLRIRLWWANMLAAWGALELIATSLTVWYDPAIMRVGTDALNRMAMVVSCLFGWFLFIYPTEAIRPGWLNWPQTFAQLLPLIGLAALDYFVPYDLRLLIGIVPIGWGILLGSHIRKYRQWCEDNLSTLEETDAQWIARYLVMLIIAGGIYAYICFSHEPTRAFTQQWYLMFMLTYSTEHILFHPDPWQTILNKVKEREEAEDQEPDDEKLEKYEVPNSVYRDKLDKWMETEKPYRSSDFQLMDLRQILPLNRTYLSQLINTEYDCNFYQFVNIYRVEEAKRLMRENPDMKIQEVSEQCGFSSPTVFARNFARETGLSPREWNNQSNNS